MFVLPQRSVRSVSSSPSAATVNPIEQESENLSKGRNAVRTPTDTRAATIIENRIKASLRSFPSPMSILVTGSKAAAAIVPKSMIALA